MNHHRANNLEINKLNFASCVTTCEMQYRVFLMRVYMGAHYRESDLLGEVLERRWWFTETHKVKMSPIVKRVNVQTWRTLTLCQRYTNGNNFFFAALQSALLYSKDLVMDQYIWEHADTRPIWNAGISIRTSLALAAVLYKHSNPSKWWSNGLLGEQQDSPSCLGSPHPFKGQKHLRKASRH